MNPPTEQLIRDYLNRVSVAARGRLGSAERREFLARMRESIERETGAPGTTDPAEVRKLLADLGDPGALVDRERARLAGEPAPAAPRSGPRSGHLTARPAAWMARRAWYGPQVAAPPETVIQAPLTGEIRVESRPISARRRPGQPAQTPSGQPRPRWIKNGAAEYRDQPSAAVSGLDATGAAPAGLDADGAAPAGPAAFAGRPVGSPARPGLNGSRGSPVRAHPPGDPESAGSRRGPVPDKSPSPSGPRRWPPRSGAQAGQADRAGRPRPRPAAPGPVGGSAWLTDLRATLGSGLGSTGAAALMLARRCPLEAGAIVLMGLGGLIYPPVWLLGAAVALLSKQWDFRDRWIGLAGPLLLVIAGTGFLVTLGGSHSSVSPYLHEAWTSAVWLSRAGALLGAGYLAWRVRRGPRQPPVPPWNRPHRF